MIDLAQFRYAIKSNTIHNTVSKTQAAERAGVCFKTWEKWEDGDRQPTNMESILLAIVFNSEPPEPKYSSSYAEDSEKVRERVKRWREKNPEKHKEYMREYMRERRDKAKEGK